MPSERYPAARGSRITTGPGAPCSSPGARRTGGRAGDGAATRAGARAGDRSPGHPTGVETGEGASPVDRRRPSRRVAWPTTSRRRRPRRDGRAGAPRARARRLATRRPGDADRRPSRAGRPAGPAARSRGVRRAYRAVPRARRDRPSRRGSRASTPRRSEPHGSWTVTRSPRPASSGGGDSTPATTNSAFWSPPRAVARAARRDASAIGSATASSPITRLAGARAAAARTARPSPVPTSIWTRSERANRSVS